MRYTITQAADRVGKGRSTIHRAIKAGHLSAHRGVGGTYYVDASELARVFPMPSPGQPTRDAMAHDDMPSGSDAAALALKVEMLEAALEREREAVAREREVADREREATDRERAASDDLRRRLDRAEARVLALSPPAASTPDPTPVTTTPPPAPQAAQERRRKVSVGATPTGARWAFLGRLWRRL